MKVASEIQQAKENCLEFGSSSMRGVSGGSPEKKSKGELSACYRCNTTSHSSKGFSLEVREKHCKAFKAKCKKCDKVGHFTDQCFQGKKIPGKKAKVSVLSAEEAATETALKAAAESSAESTVPATGPAATLNSVEKYNPINSILKDIQITIWRVVGGGPWKL